MTRKPKPPLVEVCVDSVGSAVAAQEGGADRVELCADLLEGGTTPSAGAIELTRRHLAIPLHVIIRPRGGDFCYTDLELDVMKRDIASAKILGADGVVFGVLKPDGSVDVKRTRSLVTLARPLSVTFHRAFDMCRDPRAALEALIELGVERVLTKGQEDSIWEGLELVAELVRRAGPRIVVMPGGGRERNARTIVERTGAREIHVVGTRTVESRMHHRNVRCSMGGALRAPEFSWSETDPSRIRGIVDALRRGRKRE
jgi:copper homeostasis protein